MKNSFYPVLLVPDAYLWNIFQLGLKEDNNKEIEKEFNIKYPTKGIVYIENYPERYISKEVKRFKFESYTITLWLIISLVLIYPSMAWLWAVTPLEQNELIIIGLILSITYFIKINIQSVNIKVEKDKALFEQELKSYNESKRTYGNRKIKADEKFLNDLKSYNKLITEAKPLFIEKIRKENIFKSNTQLRREANLSIRGRTELILLERLIEIFEENILVDYCVEFETSKYIPDFILKCRSGNLYIDIEIDEPYTKIDEKLQPIHYVNGSDEKRNKIFLENNWIVIRFTENQIINNLDEVADFIKQIHTCIENYEAISVNNNIALESRWTYEEALIMIKKNSRKLNLT
jgi:very-short-patch-repair endonuclease